MTESNNEMVSLERSSNNTSTSLVVRAYVEPSIDVPSVPGFVKSSFAPTVFDAAGRALRKAQLSHEERAGTGVLLLTPNGDSETRDIIRKSIDEGLRISPLLFLQSTPSSIIGKIAHEWGLRGFITTISTHWQLDDPLMIGIASELVDDNDLHAIIMIRQIPPTPHTAGAAEASVLVRKRK